METINIIFISFIIIGFILIIYSLVKVQKNENNNSEIFTVEEAIKKLKTQIEDADKVMNELNSLAEQIFLQFQEKRQELLFLYDLIEQKQKDISPNIDITIDGKAQNETKENEVQNETKEKKQNKNYKKYENPLLEQILEMKEKGISNSEIAKSMNVGKGEIELILNLWKEYSYE